MQGEADRKLGLKLIPIKLLKISTPNSGGGFTVEGHKFKGISKTAFDILGETPQTAEPIAGLRFVFPDTLAAPKPTKATQAAKVAKAAPVAPKPMDEFAGRFVLTAVDVTADKIASDQVNIHRLQKFSRLQRTQPRMVAPRGHRHPPPHADVRHADHRERPALPDRADLFRE
jgi:hypothetical protein